MARKGRRRQDHLARRAQAEGFHARSVYKLQEIDQRYQIFARAGRGASVLDLGAAPGSWSQYAVSRGMAVVAVDLKEMSVAGSNGTAPQCIVGDFTEPSVAQELATSGPYAVVMSDAAPATTGNRIVDTGRSEALVASIIDHIPLWLASGGSCVCKVFQGGGEQALLTTMRGVFQKAALFRPKAVRSESFETYVVGVGYVGVPALSGD